MCFLAQQAQVEKTAKGYMLTLKKVYMKNILAFSDRPYHVKKHISVEQLTSLWHSGENNFTDSPPNAAIVMDEKVQAVQLISIQIKGNEVSFNLAPDDGPIQEMSGSHVSVFIDGVAEDPDEAALARNCAHDKPENEDVVESRAKRDFFNH